MPYKDKDKQRAYHLAYYHKHKNDLGAKERKSEIRRKSYLKNREEEKNLAYQRFLKKRNNPVPLEMNQLYFFDNILLISKIKGYIKKMKSKEQDYTLKSMSREIPIPYQTLLGIYKKTKISKKKTLLKICNFLSLPLEEIIKEKTVIGKNILKTDP